jgi:hypothetical protein
MASLDLPPPSPPAEKAATSSDQTGQSRPGYGAGDKDVSGHRDGEADVPQANLSNRKQPSRLTRGEQHRRDRKPERLRGDQVPIIAAEPPPQARGASRKAAWSSRRGIRKPERSSFLFRSCPLAGAVTQVGSPRSALLAMSCERSVWQPWPDLVTPRQPFACTVARITARPHRLLWRASPSPRPRCGMPL